MADVVFGNFTWDSEKERVNIKKHSISFKMALRVFEDSKLVELFDKNNSTLEEERYDVIGCVDGIIILFVVITEKSEMIRIISARKATPEERRIYEDERI